ncbi:MAG: hypothetical protein ACRDQA_07250, partial [Nocardioidaceae bacterium]
MEPNVIVHRRTCVRRRLSSVTRAVLAAVVGGAVLVSCGEPLVVQGGAVVSDPYDGPLYVEVDHPRSTPVPQRYGAAGLALDCAGRAGTTGGLTDSPKYDNGAVADDPEEALETAKGEGGFVGAMSGYQLARMQETRALFAYLVDGNVMEAVIVHDGPTLTESGWHIESWARCDWSELPDAIAQGYGIQVWSGEAGHRVPSTLVKSFP